MVNPYQGPHLILRNRKGRNPVFAILDGGTEVSCQTDDRERAETILAAYKMPHKRQFKKFQLKRRSWRSTENDGFCFLYVIEMIAEDHPVKIGIAKDVRSRLWNLQCGSPFEMRLLASAKCHHSLEHIVHDFLTAHAIRGEWFRRSEKVNAFIDAVTAGSLHEHVAAHPQRADDVRKPARQRKPKRQLAQPLPISSDQHSEHEWLRYASSNASQIPRAAWRLPRVA